VLRGQVLRGQVLRGQVLRGQVLRGQPSARPWPLSGRPVQVD
jgi:hypothetical protein